MIGEVKACPFCGNTNLQVGELSAFLKGRYFVHCNNCGTSGPLTQHCDDETTGAKAAIELWNKRYSHA